MVAERRSERVLLLVILAFTLLVVLKQVHFSLNQTAPVGRDWDFHLQLSYIIHGCHFNYHKIIQWYAQDKSSSVQYPPLFYLISALIVETGRFSPWESIYLSLTFWIIVLVFSLYAAGKRLGRSPWSGFAATSIAGLSFVVIHTESFDISLDFPAMAAVALAVCSFYFTNDFMKQGASLLLGVCCGVAFLTKPVTLVYLLPFLVSALMFPLGQRSVRASVRFKNAILSMLAGLAVAGCFVFPLLPLFFKKMGQESLVQWQQMVVNWGTYFRMLTYTPCTVVFLMGLVPGFFLVKKRDRAMIPFVVSTAVSVLFFSKMRTPALGYFYPLQVWSALLWARWMGNWSEKTKKVGSIILALVFVAPVIITTPGGRYRDLRFDTETERNICSLAGRLSGLYRSLQEDEVGYLLPNNAGACTIRRGVFGSAVALARPGNPWTGLLEWQGENVALFCQDSMDSEKIEKIVQKKMIVVIAPEQFPENQELCMASWNEAIALIQASHRQELRIPYRFYAHPGLPPQGGFTCNYTILIFMHRDVQNTPCFR